jgi:hypothetical protein
MEGLALAMDSSFRGNEAGRSRALNGFLGGSVATVAVRLLVVSFVVGLFLTMFGFDPEDIYLRFVAVVRHVVDFGLTDLRHFGRIMLTGAMLVVPIWLVLRLFDTRRGR